MSSTPKCKVHPFLVPIFATVLSLASTGAQLNPDTGSEATAGQSHGSTKAKSGPYPCQEGDPLTRAKCVERELERLGPSDSDTIGERELREFLKEVLDTLVDQLPYDLGNSTEMGDGTTEHRINECVKYAPTLDEAKRCRTERTAPNRPTRQCYWDPKLGWDQLKQIAECVLEDFVNSLPGTPLNPVENAADCLDWIPGGPNKGLGHCVEANYPWWAELNRVPPPAPSQLPPPTGIRHDSPGRTKPAP